MSTDIFIHHRTVRFGECDPAGVVYYPVFFNWFHEAMEAWFEQELGISYAEVLETCGFPAADISSQFRKPVQMGEEIMLHLLVEHLGRSSLALRINVCDLQGMQRATALVRCVCIGQSEDGFQFRPMEIPAALRTEMQRFVALG